MSQEELVEEEYDSDSYAESIPSGTLKESSKSKPLIKFTYITKKGEKYQMTEEETKTQKSIEQAVKANVVRSKIKKGKKYLTDIVGQDVVEKMRQKLDALHKTEQELELDLNRPLEEQDPIIKLNLLAKKKRKNVDDLHDYFKSTKRYKKSVLLHQGPGMDDLAKTFSSFSVAEVDKRNLNPNKQMRLIEQLSLYGGSEIEDKTLARALVQLDWQCQAERCRSPLRS
ncbi:hypothetical protein Tco_0273691 [Tanacetum coccineum]